MKSAVTAIAVLFLAVGACQAADPTDPVREVIKVAAGNWAAENPTSEEVFGESRLDRLFSADFAKAYREASKHPAYDPPEGETTGYPFDYDPIAGGQDGCPFENIRIENDGDGQVTALFNNHKCFGDGAEYQADTVLIFHVREEGGRALIDDIYPVVNGNSGQSIKDELKAIAAQ
ncbi:MULTISPECIES: hypothetical protein [Alphaproteobacteria]|uniref:DUF3828 domain-containing protein n=2 Tax=Alphaproteobacteria TaxID=28211 RepID=A0A512HCS4_9HYPH|nr:MULTISPECIES: hypothetical protein [Alphaproteobacteria]GEO83170.1 hypothetical protein RNA01_01020 [Ciceribacter naphthalenivorans]GLR20435.1 hypothetical protein GCM10007920_02190 [Ciceribacter naphthalenivorans]GLT03291.1 hypothetical protein GCM10007926_02190 [Sphingomonas psychrolutea]